MAVDFPSTLYKEHIPLLISTIPTNKRQTPNIIFSPLLLLQYIFLLNLTGLSLYRLVSSYKSSHKTS